MKIALLVTLFKRELKHGTVGVVKQRSSLVRDYCCGDEHGTKNLQGRIRVIYEGRVVLFNLYKSFIKLSINMMHVLLKLLTIMYLLAFSFLLPTKT